DSPPSQRPETRPPRHDIDHHPHQRGGRSRTEAGLALNWKADRATLMFIEAWLGRWGTRETRPDFLHAGKPVRDCTGGGVAACCHGACWMRVLRTTQSAGPRLQAPCDHERKD